MSEPRRTPLTARTKLVVAGLAVLGIGFFVAAWQVASDGGSDDVSVTRTEGLLGIEPDRGSEVLKQAPVSVTLEPGWRVVTMRLFDNPGLNGGTDVTTFVREVEGLNQFVYSPGEGRPWAEHSADDNCVVVEFEEIATPGRVNDIDWCFTAS